jgi:hypothetical protein
MPLGALWARDEIERLEDRRIASPMKDAAAIDERIASLGLEHQVQTRLTSFVAVDEDSQVHGEALELVQPVPAPADRSSLRLASRVAGSQGSPDINVRGNVVALPRSGRMPASPAAPPTDDARADIDTGDSPMEALRRRMQRLENRRVPRTPKTHHARTGVPRWYLEPSLQAADECMMMQAAAAGHTPILELLGRVGDAPMHMRDWLAWRDAGMQYLGACFDAEDLRQALAFLERHFHVASTESDAPLDVTMALTLLPMIEACHATHRRGRDLPVAIADIDLSHRGTLWRRCIASLESRRSRPGWSALEQAMTSGTLHSMISAVTHIAAAIYVFKRDEAWAESGGAWSRRKMMLGGDWLGDGE